MTKQTFVNLLIAPVLGVISNEVEAAEINAHVDALVAGEESHSDLTFGLAVPEKTPAADFIIANTETLYLSSTYGVVRRLQHSEKAAFEEKLANTEVEGLATFADAFKSIADTENDILIVITN